MKSKVGANLYMEYGWSMDEYEQSDNSDSNDNYLGRASEAWLSERDEYTYDRVSWSNFENTGHYTQMIWSNTQYVGIASAISESGGVCCRPIQSSRGLTLLRNFIIFVKKNLNERIFYTAFCCHNIWNMRTK